MKNNIEIKIVKSWEKNEIIELYKSAGWWKKEYKESGIEPLIKNSYLFVVAYDKNKKKAIGMGRLISDGISDGYIQDLVVLKEFRNYGIGTMIINFILDFCKSKELLWIGLISEPDQDKFYEKIGFKKMKNHIPMKYEEDKLG